MLEKQPREDNDRLREIAPGDRDHSGTSAGSRPRVFPTNLLYFLPQRVPQQARNPGGLHGGEREPNKRVSLTPSIFCSMQFRRRYSSLCRHSRPISSDRNTWADLRLDSGSVGSRRHFLAPADRLRAPNHRGIRLRPARNWRGYAGLADSSAAGAPAARGLGSRSSCQSAANPGRADYFACFFRGTGLYSG